MKIRSSFVSNSSSSSFVIAKKKDKDSKIKITFEINLDSFTDATISTQEELDKYFRKEMWDESTVEDTKTKSIEELGKKNPDDYKTYKQYQKLLADGYIIMNGSFSDENDNPIETFLCMNGIPGKPRGFKILQSGGGY